MARLIAVTCPKCGADVELDADTQRVKCAYCGTSSLVRPDAEPAADIVSSREALAATSKSAREDAERSERARRVAEEARLAVLRREDELRLQLSVQEERARERTRRIVILVLAALPISAFLALYLTK